VAAAGGSSVVRIEQPRSDWSNDSPYGIRGPETGLTRRSVAFPDLPELAIARHSDQVPADHPANAQGQLRQHWDAMLIELAAELDPVGDILN
jgi:hypothetical protein